MTGLESFLLSLLLNILILELSPKPKLPQARKYGLNDFSFPTATEDRAQTVGFGTFKVAGNVVWYGDYNPTPVTEKVNVSLFQKKTLTKGHLYRVGMWMTLCGVTCDEVQEIRLGDNVVWSGNQTLSKTEPTVIDVNKRFTSAEGQEIADGIVGRFVFFNQRVREGEELVPIANPYMERFVGAGNVPAYPNTLHVLWLGPTAFAEEILMQGVSQALASIFGFVSTGPAVSPLTFVVKRAPDLSDVLSQVLPGTFQSYYDATWKPFENVQGDANPAYCALEVLTSRVPGMGPRMGAYTLDLDSFLAAAQRFHQEGHGVSFAWELSRPVSDLLADISTQTASVLDVNERTGQLTTRLLRADDEPVASFDENNLIEVSSFTRVAVDQAPNRVEVPFVDRNANWVDRVAFAKNTAAIKSAGTVIDQQLQFIGVSREALAQKLATRELSKASTPLAKASFAAWLPVGMVLKPGDLVLFKHPTLNQTLRMRVVSSRFGGYQRALRVEIEAIEDVFRGGYSFDTGSTPLPGTGTNEPPVSLTQPTFTLAPYALTGDDADHGLYIANDPGTGVNTYRLAVRQAAGWSVVQDWTFEDTEQEPAISGVLDYALSSNEQSPTLSLTISTAAAQQFARQSRQELFVVVGNEWFQASNWTLSANSLTATTVSRGIFDTVPQRHEAGASARVLLGYVVTAGRLRTQASAGSAATDGATILTARAESRGSNGVLTVDDTSDSQATLESVLGVIRASAPLLPGAVKLEGVLGSLNTADGSLSVPMLTHMTVSWANRNRLSRLLAPYFEAGNDAEAGVQMQLTLEYLDGNGAWQLVDTFTAPAGATEHQFHLHNVASAAPVRCTLQAVNGDRASQPLTVYWLLS